MDNNICEVKTSPVSNNDLSADIRDIFEYWQNIMIHPKAKLDKKRQNKISKALKLGYTVAQLKQAIDGCANNTFNMGDNDRKQRYDDVDLIFRDASHIERFINNSASNNVTQNHSIMDGAI